MLHQIYFDVVLSGVKIFLDFGQAWFLIDNTRWVSISHNLQPRFIFDIPWMSAPIPLYFFAYVSYLTQVIIVILPYYYNITM